MNRFVLVLIWIIPTLKGCVGSTYILGNVASAELVHLRLYSVVAPTIPAFERNHWQRKSRSLESDDLFLFSRWEGSFSAAVSVVRTRSKMKTVDELQSYVANGGIKGIHFEEPVAVRMSQPNLLCVRPSLYSQVTLKEGSGRFVYLMACVDTRTKIHYELGLSQDIYEQSSPKPSNGLKVGADNFFTSFKVK